MGHVLRGSCRHRSNTSIIPILSPSLLHYQIKKILLCKACYEKFTRVWYYSCEQCKDFVMDIPCTLLLPTTINCIKPESDQIQHFLHGHPLSLRKADDQELTMHCRVCDKRCAGPTYVCDSGRASSLFCKKIYFHKSCLEFPQQICHPFHPYHVPSHPAG